MAEEVTNLKKQNDELTDTSRFLLPALKLTQNELLKFGFIDCFLVDKHKTFINEKDIHLYLLFKPNTDKQQVIQLGGFLAREKESQYTRLTTKIEELTEQDPKHNILLDEYDYEGGYIVLVLKFPEKFRSDYELFKIGKYSKFSDTFKDIFPPHKKVTLINQTTGKEEIIEGNGLAYMIVTKNKKAKAYAEKKWGISIDEDNEYWRLPNIEKRETLDIEKIYSQNNITE